MHELLFLLKKIGLSDKEIALYIGLLEQGPSSVRDLARLARINRGTTYDVLKSLMQKGLVSYYDKKTRRLFNPEDPEHLQDYYETQIKEFEHTKRTLQDIIVQLKSQQKLPDKPMVRFFEGDKGVRAILLDVIQSFKKVPKEKRQYYIYSSYNIRNALYRSFKNFTEERINHGIAVKAIAIGKGGDPQPLAQRKWLDREKEGTPTYKIIYHNKIALISHTHNKLIGTIIEDPSLFATEQYTFEYLWNKI